MICCGGLSVGAALLLNSYLVNAFLAKGMAPAAASGVATLLNVPADRRYSFRHRCVQRAVV